MRRSGSSGPPPDPAAEHVPVEMEDRLAGACADIDDDRGNRRGRPSSPSRRRSRASASPRPRSNSRDVAECRRCAARGSRAGASSAFGLMSRIATKPVALVATSIAARGRACRRGSPGQAARIPSSVTARAANPDELANRRVERATASSRRRSRGPGGRPGRRPRRPTFVAPARAGTRPARAHAAARSRSLLTCAAPCRPPRSPSRVAVSTGRRAPSRSPAASTTSSVRREGARRPRPGSRRSRRVVRLKSPAAATRRRYVAAVVASRHRAQHAVVAGLERHVQMPRRPSASRAARRRSAFGQVVDLDRREPQPREPGRRARLAHQPRQVVAGLAVAVAAEVDPGQNDLAVPLVDAPPHLGEHGRRALRLREAPRTSGITQKRTRSCSRPAP